MTRHSPRRRPLLTTLMPCIVGGALSLLAACTDAVSAPATPPHSVRGGKVLGVVEVTLTGIGTGDMHATARAVSPVHGASGFGVNTASNVHPALLPLPGTKGTIELAPLSTGSFTKGVRGSDGERYLYATFKVRNATQDSIPYLDARTNLTFLAVSTGSPAPTIGDTPIASMLRFDGSPASSTIAAQFLPTGAVTQDADNVLAPRFPDVLQVITEGEAAAIPAPSVTRVFPYGFVVHNPNDPMSRTLPANPAVDQFDGMVTFAFKVPLQAAPADDPFTVSAMFLAVDDDATRLTQSMEEQTAAGAAAVEARARALGATALTLLPSGSAVAGNGAERVICSVRTAGDAGSPTATLDLPSGSEPWLVPSPWGADAPQLPRTAQLAVARCPSIASADASSFVVHGFQSGGVSGTYTGVGTSLVHAPAASFFPGEEVEVTLTTALGGTTATVARYRVAASGGSGVFDSLDTRAVGSLPMSITAADLDGDGDLDLAVANVSSANLSILQNDGSGAFTSLATLTAGANPRAVTAADLDGDGDLDLAVANIGGDNVTILQNDGSASFRNAGSAATGAAPIAITAADLDGDGDVDLATANQNSANVSILRNDGNGGFTNAGSAAAGDEPLAITAADLDADGDVDLATADFSSNTASILQNDGSGAFTRVAAPTAGANPRAVTAGDLDGDGDFDLAVLNEASDDVSILWNNGGGGFTNAGSVATGNLPVDIMGADLDGDGDLDLATANEVSNDISILRNNGRGGFTSAGSVAVGNQPFAVTAADLDGDGDLDLAVANGLDWTVWLLQNQ